MDNFFLPSASAMHKKWPKTYESIADEVSKRYRVFYKNGWVLQIKISFAWFDNSSLYTTEKEALERKQLSIECDVLKQMEAYATK
jgi:hypothetical protein